MLATSVTICLEIVSCVNADGNSQLLAACSVGAALESVVLLILGGLGLAQVLRTKVSLSWKCSRPAFIFQLVVCIAALVASAVALACLQKWTTDVPNDAAPDLRQKLFVGSVIAVTIATVLQLGFIIFQFTSSRDIALGTASSFHSNEEGRKMNIKAIRYSRTIIGANTQEMTSVPSNESSLPPAETTTMGPIEYLKASVSSAIRPTSSRTKLLGSERRRPISLDSMPPPRTSTDTSFDSWDTSCVDVHNRQAVMDMSSPTTTKRGLETIPASPSGSRTTSRPGTPLDMELEPPRMLYRTHSYSSSLQSQQDLHRLTPDSSVNELHIHPLFRSDSPTPPPAASPGTVVLAAPNAGQVISRQGSMQSISRLRSGSLPAGHSPLVHQTSFNSLKQAKLQDDGDIGRKSSGGQNERKMTPPVPEWLLSPSMKASLESFKEQKQSTTEESDGGA